MQGRVGTSLSDIALIPALIAISIGAVMFIPQAFIKCSFSIQEEIDDGKSGETME